MEMTCRICGFRGAEAEFVPDMLGEHDPDWVCPHCLCGGYSASTLCEDFFEHAEVESVL